jgi:hypothetical protein
VSQETCLNGVYLPTLQVRGVGGFFAQKIGCGDSFERELPQFFVFGQDTYTVQNAGKKDLRRRNGLCDVLRGGSETHSE